MSTAPLSRSLRLSRIVVYALPVLFVVASWIAGRGLPYYLDNNESFLLFVQARNLEIWSPWTHAWMSSEATDPTLPAPEHFYTHNPNGPRYLHYLLSRVGVRDLAPQVLILSLLGTLLVAALLWRIFGQPALAIVALALVLDYAGFLAWTVNTYRIWMFVSYFGLILAVVRFRPIWVAVLTFLIFQLDFGDAIFVCASAGLLAMLEHGWRARGLLLASFIGALASVAVFGSQVVAFYGWAGFLQELAVTYARRGVVGEATGLGVVLYHAWHGPMLLLGSIARDTHSPFVMVVVLAGIVFALRTMLHRAARGPQRFLAHVVVATAGGAVTTSTLLYGYFVHGYVVSLLPLSTLLIAPSVGLLALELRRLLSQLWGSPQLGVLTATLAVMPVVLASAARFEPPMAADLFWALQTEYRGRTIVAPNVGPWLANDGLAFALTGGRALRTSDVDVTTENLRSFEALREEDGTLTYMCLDTLYLRQITRPGAQSVCDLAKARMVPRGHQVVADGSGWTIMRLVREHEVPGQALDSALGTVGRATPSTAEGEADAAGRPPVDRPDGAGASGIAPR